MGFGTELFQRLEEARRPMLSAMHRLVRQRLFPVAAPEWMVSQYHIIRATEPTLKAAFDLCLERAEDGEGFCNVPLAGYFGAKLSDERGHDVLLLQDLERIGKGREEIERAPTDPDIAAAVGSQLYLMRFEHPATYLGFIAMLEAFPPTTKDVEAFAVAAGLPIEALSCAMLHAKADVAHREDLRAILDVTPEELRPGIVRNALQCLEYQRQALNTLSRRLESFEKDLKARAIETPPHQEEAAHG